MKRYLPEEDEELLYLKKQGLTAKQIARKLQNISGERRSSGSIAARFYHLTRRNQSTVEPSSENSDKSLADETRMPGYDIGKQVEVYDMQNLRDVLKKRSDFIYSLMSDQAKRIKYFDSQLKYRNMTFEDIMKLDSGEREEIIAMIQKSKVEEINEIGIPWGFNCHNNTTSVVLPVYHTDVKTSSRTLASSLNDSLIQTLDELKLEMGENFEDRFKDLARYNFSGYTRQNPGSRITELVRKEHSLITNVYFVDDSLEFSISSDK